MDCSFQPHATICGHSFVSHLRHFTNASTNHFNDNLGLQNVSIEWRSKGGKTWSEFERLDYQYIVLTKPTILYVELGGNDLDSDICAHALAQKALDLAEQLVQNGISRIILGEVMQRYKTRNIPTCTYNAKVKDYNNFLREKLMDPACPRKSEDRFLHRHIWFWDHLRLKVCHLPLLKEDGVHLTDNPGNKRLYRSIRLALMQALALS